MQIGADPELRNNRALLWLLVLATIPVGVFGLLFNEQAETTWRNPFVIGGMLIAVGVLMWFAENAGRRKRDIATLSVADAAAIGAAQALAIVPGTSRSGITITAGLFRDLTRESAARFSFLLSTPAIGAAALKSLHGMQKAGRLHDVLATDFLLGMAVSALTGMAVITWFLHYLRRAGFRPFVYYRIVFGIIVIALAFIRRPA
jgi:undecaprenyl-diphosphatase